MKFWVALAALTLLAAGCGAEPDAPTPAPTPSPAPTWRLWGLLGALGEAAENATERLRQNEILLKLQAIVRELQDFRSEARARAAEYAQEARAMLELSVADLRARGAALGRKFRKRLGRDHEELRRRWEGGVGAIRALWERPQTQKSPGDGEETP